MTTTYITGNEITSDLDSFAAKMTVGRSLREGMILVDPDLGTPVYELDHRMPNEPGRWMVYSYEDRRWTYTTLSANRSFPVGVAQ